MTAINKHVLGKQLQSSLSLLRKHMSSVSANVVLAQLFLQSTKEAHFSHSSRTKVGESSTTSIGQRHLALSRRMMNIDGCRCLPNDDQIKDAAPCIYILFGQAFSALRDVVVSSVEVHEFNLVRDHCWISLIAANLYLRWM